MRILLLQARYADDPAKAEEVQSFARACELPLTAFSPHDLLEGPPTAAELAAYDAMMELVDASTDIPEDTVLEWKML